MEKLREIALLGVPRILGLIDRDPSSPTAGCCDRYYWHYKLHDLPNARFQEACVLLALLHENNFDGNIYYKKQRILDWVFSIIKYWLSRLNSDGSTSEVYPNERSFCATSFSSLGAAESLLMLLGSNDGRTKEAAAGFVESAKVRARLEKTGQWLNDNFCADVANQMAAAVAAMHAIGVLTANGAHAENSRKRLDILKAEFERHGYFPEYGGLDIGYSSITNSTLAWLNERLESKELAGIIARINARLDARIDALGNYDYTATSRNTQFLYPYGFFAAGSKVMKKILNGAASNRIITPLWMDDRYAIALTADYIKTYIEFNSGGRMARPEVNP